MPRYGSEAPAFISTLLCADIAVHFIELKTDGRDRISARPEILAREVAFPALKLAGNRNRALAPEKPTTKVTACLGGMTMHIRMRSDIR